MSAPAYTSYSDYKNNWQPYDSPVEVSIPVELQAPATAVSESESPIAFIAAICLLIGYLATNVMLIDDIYFGKPGSDGRSGTSPFSMFRLSRNELTQLYLVGCLVTVVGAAVVACKKMPSYGGIILVMCPLVLFIYFVGKLLQDAGCLARYLAGAYLFGGIYLTGSAVLYFLNTPAPLPAFSIEPMFTSMSLQGGMTLVIISILTLRKA